MYSLSELSKEIAETNARVVLQEKLAFRTWLTKQRSFLSSLSDSNNTLLKAEKTTIEPLPTKNLNISVNCLSFSSSCTEVQTTYCKIVNLCSSKKENIPDNWERNAMLEFSNGTKEILEFTDINGECVLRLIQPLVIDESCLQCHLNKDFKVGSIGGGISITIPMQPVFDQTISSKIRIIALHISLIIVGFIGITTIKVRYSKNISENAKVRAKLKEKDERLNLAHQASNAGVWDWNIRSREATFDERWAAISGYTLKELEPINIETWNNLIHPADLRKLDQLLEKHFAHEFEDFEFETRMKHKNGKWIWIQIRGKVIEWDEKKRPIRMIGVILDITENKLAIKKLEESESKYRLLAENAVDAVWKVNMDLNFIYASPEFYTFTGFSTEELLKMNSRELFTPEKFAEALKILEEELANREKHAGRVFETYHLRKDGNEVPVEISAKIIWNDKWEPIGISGYTRDITERKRNEEIIKSANARFTSIMNSLDATVYVADMETYELLFINNSLREDIGNYKGKVCWEVLQKDQTGPCEFCTNEKLLAKDGKPGRIYSWEFQNKKNQKWYLIKDRAITWNDGRIVRLEIATDITESKNIANALKESEIRFRTTFNQAVDPIFIAKISEENIPIIYDINNSVIEKIGYNKEELIGKPMSLIHANEKKINILERVRELLSGKELNFETIQRKKDGSLIPIEMSAKKIEINGTPYIYIIERDISERKKWEKEILEMQQKLLEENNSKDKFFSIISHDLKSPFGVLLSIAQLLEDNFDEMENSEIKEMLKVTRNSAENIYDLLEGLLEWSLASSNRLEFLPNMVDLNEITNNVLLVQSQNAINKNINIINSIENETFVFADKKMLSTILRNLISNGIKFTSQSGKIIISSNIVDGKLEVSVSDNGIGISELEIEKLFRIDIHHTTVGTERESGTGVGLILCKELVEKNGGKIWVKSEVGKGSIFKFTLPIG
jgi:PAS domain S-box-containing protein